MKLNTLVLASSIILSSSMGVSAQNHDHQDDNKSKSRFKITSAAMSTGFTLQFQQQLSINDFKSLSPNSSILNRSVGSNINIYQSHMPVGQFNYGMNVGVAILGRNGRPLKGNPTLRLGFQYNKSGDLSTRNFGQNSRFYDSFKSNSGQTLFFDSVTIMQQYARYSTEQLLFDASLIFSTKMNRRWQLYGGVGLGIGASFNNNTYTQFTQMSGLRKSNNENYYGFHSNDISSSKESELTKNKNGLIFNVYVPVGISYTLGNKHHFWKRVSLFYEGRVGLNASQIPELGTKTNTYLQHSLGVRFRF